MTVFGQRVSFVSHLQVTVRAVGRGKNTARTVWKLTQASWFTKGKICEVSCTTEGRTVPELCENLQTLPDSQQSNMCRVMHNRGEEQCQKCVKTYRSLLMHNRWKNRARNMWKLTGAAYLTTTTTKKVWWVMFNTGKNDARNVWQNTEAVWFIKGVYMIPPGFEGYLPGFEGYLFL